MAFSLESDDERAFAAAERIAIRVSAQAADRAFNDVKEVFRMLGYDISAIRELNELRADLEFSRESRLAHKRRAEWWAKGVGAGIVALLGAVASWALGYWGRHSP